MKKNIDEIEMVRYPRIDRVNIFFVNLINRTTHFHKEIEICCIMDGRMQIETKSGSFTVGQGDVLLFNSNEPHSLLRLEGSSLLLSIQLSPDILNQVFPAVKKIEFLDSVISAGMSGAEGSELVSVLYSMTSQYFHGGLGAELSLFSKVYYLFYFLLQKSKYKIINHEEYSRRMDQQIRITRISDYIRENLSHKLCLGDIARRENLSTTYLSHLFRDSLNISYQEYVSNLRFERALKLLTHTDLKILDISMECGFSDRKYLNKAFLRNCGYLPKEYRRKLKSMQNRKFSHPKSVHPLTTQRIYRGDKEITVLLQQLNKLI